MEVEDTVDVESVASETTDASYEICEGFEDEIGVDESKPFHLEEKSIYTAKNGLKWNVESTFEGDEIVFDKTQGSKLTPFSESLRSPSDAFKLLFSPEVAAIMIEYTNKHAATVENWVTLEEDELYAFIGIFVLIGLQKARKRSLMSLWTTNYFLKMPFYSMVMSRNRFSDILCNWRFDDIEKRAERILVTGDKLVPIRDVYEIFRQNFMRAYIPSAVMTVDERMIPFRGKCGHKVYMPAKPGSKYGQKQWTIADASSRYVYNMQIYFGGSHMLSKNNQTGEKMSKTSFAETSQQNLASRSEELPALPEHQTASCSTDARSSSGLRSKKKKSLDVPDIKTHEVTDSDTDKYQDQISSSAKDVPPARKSARSSVPDDSMKRFQHETDVSIRSRKCADSLRLVSRCDTQKSSKLPSKRFRTVTAPEAQSSNNYAANSRITITQKKSSARNNADQTTSNTATTSSTEPTIKLQKHSKCQTEHSSIHSCSTIGSYLTSSKKVGAKPRRKIQPLAKERHGSSISITAGSVKTSGYSKTFGHHEDSCVPLSCVEPATKSKKKRRVIIASARDLQKRSGSVPDSSSNQKRETDDLSRPPVDNVDQKSTLPMKASLMAESRRTSVQPVATRSARRSAAQPSKKIIREEKQGKRVVLDMVEGLEGSNREIVTDNFFTSAELADELYNQHLLLTGTMRQNRMEIPKDFLPNKKKEQGSVMVAHNSQKTLTSFVCARNKAVIFLSTNRAVEGMGYSEKGVEKPNVNLHYNLTKIGVDVVDQITREHSIMKPTRRWPVAAMLSVIEMAIHNAQVLYTTKFPQWEKNNPRQTEIFLQKLSFELVRSHVSNRYKKSLVEGGVNKTVLEDMEKFLKTFEIDCSGCNECMTTDCLKLCTICNDQVCPKHSKEIKTYICIACSGEPTKHRTSSTKSVCYYCTKTYTKSLISSVSCNACICTQHRLQTKKNVCNKCK